MRSGRVNLARASALVGLGLLLATCQGSRTEKPKAPVDTAPGRVLLQEPSQPGLSYVLREGEEGGGRQAGLPQAAATALSDERTKALFGRLPPLEGQAGDERSFALRERSLPPARAGKTVTEEFPPRSSGPARPTGTAGGSEDEKGPLAVLRHQPEGEVGLAPHVTVTFSQPMVALSSQDETKKTRPVKLTPEPAGSWRWIGTKTTLFEPAPLAGQKGGSGRFPMATEYRVEIPAGTKSATGGVLDKAVSFTFTTPAPQVTTFWPQVGPTTREPLLFAAFDQRIDAAQVLATIHVTADGKPFALRMATAEEIAADEQVKRYADEVEAGGRWLAFRAVEKLPTDASVSVEVGPGTPSAEGPRKTERAQSYSFRTYGPMRVDWHSCQSRSNACPPMSGFSVRFTNPVDVEKLDAKTMVSVLPEIPGLKVEAYGNSLAIYGKTKGKTQYEVTLAATLPDKFGQTLEKKETLSFFTGSASQQLFSTAGPFVVLDPVAGPKFSVYSVNHRKLRVKVFAAGPEQWSAFGTYMRETFHREAWPPEPPLKKVVDEVVQVEGEDDELTETRVDLSKGVGAHGSVVVMIEPSERPKNRWEWQPVIAWVQVTELGLDAFVDGTDLVAWVTNLADGKALAGVNVSLWPKGPAATTADSGLATLPLADEGGQMVIARRGKDVAFLPRDLSFWYGESGWRRSVPGTAVVWYVADDRQMYRPGEEVKLKGWLRRVDQGKGGDVAGYPGGGQVSYQLMDSVGNEISKGTAGINAAGGFDLSLTLPKTMNLGYTPIRLSSSGGGATTHAIQVQEFRRPEFEVSAEHDGGPHRIGGQATVTVSASYYAGGGLPNAETTWSTVASPGSFTPPNRGEWSFGPQSSWWSEREDVAPNQSQTFVSRTDSSGKHRLGIDFLGVNPPRAMNLAVSATVMDVNRQAWTASTSLLVHPADLYVGLKLRRPFVEAGQKIDVSGLVVDLDGKMVGDRQVGMRAVRLDWEWKQGKYKTTEVDAQTCDVTSSGRDPISCSFAPKEGGLYRVTATVSDSVGRRNQSQVIVWVSGGKMPPARGVEKEEVRLLPDKTEYGPGETAEIAVIPPWYPAEGVLTLRRSGLVKTERFRIEGASYTAKVKVEEGYTPNLHVQVDLVGAAPRTDDEGRPDPKLAKRPALASGSVNLVIPPVQRKLGLTVTPKDKALEPGGETVLDVELKDARGQAVAGGEVAVVVVDESVLSLTGYRLPDPLATFYTQRAPMVSDHHLRESIALAKPTEALGGDGARGAPGGGGFAKGMAMDEAMPMRSAMPPPAPSASPVRREAKMAAKPSAVAAQTAPQPPQPAIAVRTKMDALAVFAPAEQTNAQGRVQVKVKLPDSLTRYRVMAVAVAGERQFGSGESAIVARLPLMVRPSPPRFLNFGDRFELPVVLQNQTDKPLEVEVAVRATNAQLTAGQGRKVKVPANDRVEVRFPAAAARAGTARFQVGAASGKWADAAQFELPVWTPATTEAFATYGTIDEGFVTQPVAMPPNVVVEHGGLEVTTSSTALQALTDAVLYLVRYPFECSEQMASRVLAVASLRDVLTAFQAAGMPSPEAMLASVERDFELLRRLQNSDGGWAFWRHDDESWPFLTLHVSHAFARAKLKGFQVPESALERAMGYLQNIEAHIPYWYDAETRRACIAYAIYVRDLLGDRDGAKARQLIASAGGLDKLGMETIGWLYPTLSRDAAASKPQLADLRRYVANRVEETAGSAHFVTGYGDGGYLLLHSDRRVDGLLLDALIIDQPKSDLIPKLVDGLLGHRTAGRWNNTQENAWVLLALDRYFNTYEKVTPDFVARVWLGAGYAGEHRFQGRTTERSLIEIPMAFLARQKSADLVVQKDGKGRLYYRIGMSYAPSDLRPPAADYGFTVERAYEAVDDPADVTRMPDGVWKVKAGARVRVRLTMVAQARRTHVALVDPLPAGLEPMNPALAVTGPLPSDPKDARMQGAYWWWWFPWYEHQNLRDERVEAFTSLLYDGVYTYTYVARATTPGDFVVPPTKAEEMYHPEVFGRSAGDRLQVLP